MESMNWKRDDGYSGYPTAYDGDLAMVVSDNSDGTYSLQVFDEGDPGAVDRGECCYSLDGIWSERAAMEIAEAWAGAAW